METAIIASILLYLFSTGAYIAYFFLQRKRLQQAGFILLLGGFVFHTAALGLDFARQGHFPATNMRETLSFAGWAIAGVFILLSVRYNLKILGVYDLIESSFDEEMPFPQFAAQAAMPKRAMGMTPPEPSLGMDIQHIKTVTVNVDVWYRVSEFQNRPLA